jgi:DNA mismatch repair protein MutS2
MLRLKLIIENSFPESLILIDEIGSGTDPVEGSAIASGILETFSELKVFYLTTTHQSSLKTFALNRNEIENASLEFDEKLLKPTYKFLMGMPGNSYAFSLARNIGISQLVLSRSQKYLDTKQHELEKGIKLINKLKRKSLNALNEANKERIKSQSLSAEYETKFSEFKKKKNELMTEARKEAQKVLENANSLIERTIKEIREGQKQAGEVKKEYLAKKKEMLIQDVSEIPQSKELHFFQETYHKKDEKKTAKRIKQTIEIGSIVTYSENPSTGKVLELDKDKILALVEFNGIKFKIKTTLLEISEEEVIPETFSRSAFVDNIKFDVQTRLDLRGERVEIALRKVDELISNAILSNVSMVSIIHGKGTGALREAIQEYLRSHQSVKSFRDGDLVEGGAGVTIVDF